MELEAVSKIIRWWRNVYYAPDTNTSDSMYTRSELIRHIINNYNVDDMLDYALYAKYKLKKVPVYNEYTDGDKKSSVRNWIMANLSASEIIYIGI